MKYSEIETSHGKEDTYRMELPAVCVPVLENIVKEMSTLIEDKNMQEIFYYLSLGHDMREVSEKTGITLRNLAYIYRKAANIVHFNWKSTMQWKKELQHAHIKCRNYESLLTIPQIITRQSPRNFILVVRDQDIPTKYVDLLTIPLEKLDICLRTLRSLRKNNIYLLEDLLRFINCRYDICRMDSEKIHRISVFLFRALILIGVMLFLRAETAFQSGGSFL